MAENVYLLKVSQACRDGVARRLCLDEAPPRVRLVTSEQLSNYGYPKGAEPALLAILDDGVAVGSENKPEAPHLFVPWHQVLYLADGSMFSEKK
jgi:hypothetical protein